MSESRHGLNIFVRALDMIEYAVEHCNAKLKPVLKIFGGKTGWVYNGLKLTLISDPSPESGLSLTVVRTN